MSAPWREGNGGAWSPRSGQLSDPDAESENRDQERQRDREEDEVDRRYAAIDDGRRGVIAAIGPTADDTAWGARLAARFATSPPVLST